MGKWSITTEKVKERAKVIEEKAGVLKTECEKLYAEVENLKTKEWEGIASTTFHEKLEGYRVNFDKTNTILKDFAQLLTTAALNYEVAETEISDAAKNLPTGN